MSDNIRALFIYEILGRPAEHIKITLEQLIDRISENKGIKIIERKVHEPHLLDEEKTKNIKIEKEIFSTFAEVEMEIDNLMLIFSIILNTLPSSVEVLKPQELRLKNFDLSNVLGELSLKLHKYDEIAKALLLEKNQMINFIKEMNKKIEELGGETIVKFEDGQDKEKEDKKGEKLNKKEKDKLKKK